MGAATKDAPTNALEKIHPTTTAEIASRTGMIAVEAGAAATWEVIMEVEVTTVIKVVVIIIKVVVAATTTIKVADLADTRTMVVDTITIKEDGMVVVVAAAGFLIVVAEEEAATGIVEVVPMISGVEAVVIEVVSAEEEEADTVGAAEVEDDTS